MSPATRYRPRNDLALRRRALVNTLNLTTPAGLAVARLGRASVRPGPDGLWLAEGYRLPFPVAGAFTVGNVVTTARTFDDLAPSVLGHEDRHAWQYAHLGVAFWPLYAASAGWSWLRYGDWASGNPFERQAGLVSGQYLADALARPPKRSVLAGVRATASGIVAVTRAAMTRASGKR